jgi:acyl-CoA synthetase (AMP-forming)/AMP-acid ligase II
MSLAAAERARRDPGGLALADPTRQLDWAALDLMLNRATNALLAESLPGGSRVAVFAHNAVETVVAYLACLHAGISAVPANSNLTTDELAYMLADSGAALLFVDARTRATGLAAAQQLGLTRVIGWGGADAAGLVDWTGWLNAASAEAPPETMPPRPYLHYTSGTTGRPKGTESPPGMFPRTRDVAGLFAASRAQIEAGPLGGPALVVGPLYHNASLGAVRRLGGGKPLVVLPRFDPEAVLAAIERWRIDSGVMVPTHFQRLLALPDEIRARYDVSSLRQVAHTGAACPVSVKRAMIAWWGPVLVEVYGGTEAGTTNMISSAEWLERPGSVGRPVAPLEMLVVGPEGEELGTGETGILYFRDPSGRGITYHNDPEKTAQAHLAPGVFTLGDIGFVDEAGYVFITDRASDMIVSGGVNIYPAEIEQVLIGHPSVADVAVIGVPNDDMGEEVKALVVSHANSTVDAAGLAQYCRERMAGYKCPRSFAFVADVGRNEAGKINKRALRRAYWPSERMIGG